MTGGRVRAVALAALLVASAVLAGGVTAQETGAEPEVDPAADAYVSEDGDVVLVYEEDGSSAQTEYDVDVESGLVYALVTDPSAASESLNATLSATATAASVRASGNLSAPRPPSLSALDLAVTGRTNDTDSRLDATVNASVTDGQLAQLIESARTAGNVTSSADRLRATGEFRADLAVPVPEAQRYQFRLTEDDGTYTVQVEQQRPLSRFEVEDWQNRSAARETIEEQFVSAARELGGDVSVTIDSYALGDGDRPRLDVAYTVVYRDIEPGIQEALREELGGNPNLTDAQVDRLVTGVTDTTIEEVSLGYEASGQRVSGNATVAVDGYGNLALAYAAAAPALAESTATPDRSPGEAFTPNATQLRETIEAQRAAGLQQRLRWSGSLTTDEDGAQVSFDYRTRADNWTAYVDELNARGIQTYDSRIDLSGTTEDDRLVVSGSGEVSGDDLFDQFTQSTEPLATGGETAALVEALRDARFQKTKLRATYGADGLRTEVGAAFGNLSAIRDRGSSAGLPAFSEAVGRTEDGRTVSYVRVPGAVSGEVTEAAVRELPAVGPETTVNMPGEWDREFPAAETERAEEFLGEIPGRDGRGVGTPGFGVMAVLAALAGVALLARRR